MSNEIKHEMHQELSIQELDTVAGGGIELKKELDQAFEQNILLDRRRNVVNAQGAFSEEETAAKNTKVSQENDFFGREF